MRKIMFRGKRKDNGEWAYGSLQCFKGYSIFDNIWNNFVSVSSKTIGQYTGLKDKAGRMIFEGDIVLIGGSNIPLVIEFTDLEKASEYATLSWNCCTPRHHHYLHRLENKSSKYEVIGNIHDNPELLEATE